MLGFKNDSVFLLSESEYSDLKDKIPYFSEEFWLRDTKSHRGHYVHSFIDVAGNINESVFSNIDIGVRPVVRLPEYKGWNELIMFGLKWIRIGSDCFISLHPIYSEKTEEIIKEADYESSFLRKKLIQWYEDKQITQPGIFRTAPNTILLGYGGSHAYGTNTPTSDIDVRGIYMNPLDELIGTKKDSEIKEIPGEDTVLYSLKKMMSLLSGCNPNVIEILGLRPKDYLYISQEGQILLDNKQIFLSKKAIFTFGQYAKAQLNRLVNKSGRSKEEIVQNETRSLQKAVNALKINDPGVSVEIMECESEPIVSITGPWLLSDFVKLYQAIDCVHTDYRSSVRNNKAVEHQKLSKHMMHLLRLYLMGIDILEKQEIITYRADEHDLLMRIRKGEYLEDDKKTPNQEFMKILTEYQKRFDEAAAKTKLPDRVDEEKVNKLMMKIVRKHYGRNL